MAEQAEHFDVSPEMRESIHDYVIDCVRNGLDPSPYVFCVMERIDFSGEGGTVITEIIADELRDHEANAELDEYGW